MFRRQRRIRVVEPPMDPDRFVMVQPSPEDRADEWYCYTEESESPFYCPPRITARYDMIGADLGPFEVDGREIMLEPLRHVPYVIDEYGQPDVVPLYLLRRFAAEQPMRFIASDGIEYQYRYSTPDRRFYRLNLFTEVDRYGQQAEEEEASDWILEEFGITVPESGGPDGIDDDGSGGDDDAVCELLDEP